MKDKWSRLLALGETNIFETMGSNKTFDFFIRNSHSSAGMYVCV